MRKVFNSILIISFGYFSALTICAQERPRRVDLSGSTSPRSTSTDGETPVGEGDVIRVDTSLVTVPVSVSDRQGRFIYDLSKEDFSI